MESAALWFAIAYCMLTLAAGLRCLRMTLPYIYYAYCEVRGKPSPELPDVDDQFWLAMGVIFYVFCAQFCFYLASELINLPLRRV